MNATSALQSSATFARTRIQVTPLQLVAGLTILALGARAIGLGMRPLWLDEAYSSWFSARGWHYLWTVVPTYEPHPPFYYSLLKIWRELFGGSAVALRSLSVLCGVATIPIACACSFELERQSPTGRPILKAAVVGFLVAFSPMMVALDQEARPYPLLALSYAIAILGVLRLFREFSSGGAGTFKSWTILCLGTTLVLWSHPLGVLYAGCLAIALLPSWLRRPIIAARLKRGAFSAAAIVLLYLPCMLILAQRTGDWGSGWLRWRPSMALQLLSLYAVPFDVLTVGSAVAAAVMLFLGKRATQSALSARGWNAERSVLLLWLAPPALSILISATFMPIFLPRTLLPTLVPAYLALGAALARTPSPRERLIITAALTITLLPSVAQAALRGPQEPWNEVSTYLKAHVRPGDQVWLYPNDSALPLREAGYAMPTLGKPGDFPAIGFKGPIRAGCPAVVSLTAEQAKSVANDPAIRRIPVIWLVTRRSDIIDPQDDLPRTLAQVRQPGLKQDFQPVAIQPFYARTR